MWTGGGGRWYGKRWKRQLSDELDPCGVKEWKVKKEDQEWSESEMSGVVE